MLDERWSDEVLEIGDALRRVLQVESSLDRVRQAEATEEGRDRRLESALTEFGLDDESEANPELHARIAFELGYALATTAYVESVPARAILKRPGVSLGFYGPVPAALPTVAVRADDGVFLQPLSGEAKRSAAGDWLVLHQSGQRGERVAEATEGDRLSRYAAMVGAARVTGAGQALLRTGVEYAKERKQFGKPIGAYQGVAHRLVDAATALDSAELLIRKAAFTALPAAFGDGAPSPVFARMVWAKSVEAARLVATAVHQTFGGTGFAMECDVQLYSRRLRSWAMRGPRPGGELAALARSLLDPGQRDAVRLLWHHDVGMPLPRWAREADSLTQSM